VLFLDELAEFPRDVLDQLRQPLESGEIWIHRAKLQTRFPCQITLVAATNPCPCGWYGHGEQPCSCGEGQRRRYWSRLSGPLLDRLDLQVVVQRVDAAQLKQNYQGQAVAPEQNPGEGTTVVSARVAEARQRMRARNADGCSNGRLSNPQFRAMVRIDDAALSLWETSVRRRGLSGRGGDRVMRVAQTISDLGGTSRISTGAMAEALSYRSYDLALHAEPN
jgi:magnesium chelatase family protein